MLQIQELRCTGFSHRSACLYIPHKPHRYVAYRRNQAPDPHPGSTYSYASVTISTLPVRSPFPNRVPSIRSAPARSTHLCICNAASSVIMRMKGNNYVFTVFQIVHTCIPPGLHRRAAWTCSTVTGRLMIALLSAVGCHTSRTALQTSSAYSGSVPVKLSGLYSNWKLPSVSSASFFRRSAPSTAIFRISSLDFLNTCSL